MSFMGRRSSSKNCDSRCRPMGPGLSLAGSPPSAVLLLFSLSLVVLVALLISSCLAEFRRSSLQVRLSVFPRMDPSSGVTQPLVWPTSRGSITGRWRRRIEHMKSFSHRHIYTFVRSGALSCPGSQCALGHACRLSLLHVARLLFHAFALGHVRTYACSHLYMVACSHCHTFTCSHIHMFTCSLFEDPHFHTFTL